MEIVGEPIVVCRDQKGNLNAFANVCRHRGVAVAMGAGNATQFSCPYRAWSYGLDGRLTAPSRPRRLGSFDYRDCRLPPLRVNTWGGFVFVSFDPGGPSLSSYLAADGYQDAVAYVHPEKMTLVNTYSFKMDCDWKLVPENDADIYRVEVIHRGTFGAATYSTKRAITQLTLTNTVGTEDSSAAPWRRMRSSSSAPRHGWLNTKRGRCSRSRPSCGPISTSSRGPTWCSLGSLIRSARPARAHRLDLHSRRVRRQAGFQGEGRDPG